VTVQTLPASGAVVTYHLCKRWRSTAIPCQPRGSRHPVRDKKSPHFPAFGQPANLLTIAFVWQSNMQIVGLGVTSQNHTFLEKKSSQGKQNQW